MTLRAAALRGPEVAERMSVSVARVSQIESGDVSTQDVLNRFVTALGGTLAVGQGPYLKTTAAESC
jgi:transcriptional regulator with XRE-family HTH domain